MVASVGHLSASPCVLGTEAAGRRRQSTVGETADISEAEAEAGAPSSAGLPGVYRHDDRISV